MMDIEPYVKPLTPAEIEAIVMIEGLIEGKDYQVTHTSPKDAMRDRRALRTAGNLTERSVRLRALSDTTTRVTVLRQAPEVESGPTPD